MKTLVGVLFLSVTSIVSAATGYYVHNLVSDQQGVADFMDPLLVNAWGIATSAASPFWTCNAGSGTSTVYAANNTPGAALGTPNAALKPTVPGAGGAPGGACTGIVANSATTAFMVTGPTDATPRSASFIFDTEDGTISGWANAADPGHAILTVDNSSSAVYKGLAIVTTPTPMLYAANFRAGTIDVFDASWKPVPLPPGAFTDNMVPSGFAPFNIWNIGGKLYVTYAKQDPNKKFDVPAAGNGYIAIYDTQGTLLRHLMSGGVLNSPWGLAIAPANFGKYSNTLLVGNFGDGLINAFNADTGAFIGTLQDANNNNIVIPGLWGLLVGNGGNGGDKDAVYFTAGPGGQKHGLLGSIQANPIITAASITNAAQSTGELSTNTFVTIKGNNLAATKRSWQTSDFTGNLLPNSVDGVTVTVGGKPAYISYLSPVQINVLTPPSPDLPVLGGVDVIVSNHNLTSNTVTVQVAMVAPSLFLINSDKYVAATHSDNRSIIGPATLIPNVTTPAKPGETVVLYANGLGQTVPPVTTGQIVNSQVPLASTPVVMVNNMPARVAYAGLSASGLYQINVVLPSSLPDGDVPVVVQVNGASSPAGALITIKN